jgi:putative flippase GtrA
MNPLVRNRNVFTNKVGQRYLVVGFIAFATDMAVYTFGLFIGLHNSQAKAISFIFGMTLSFLLNRSFTFRRSETRYGKAKFASVYLSALVVNVSINNLLLTNLAQDNKFSKFVAFFIASGIAIIINFLGMNFIVFKREEVKHIV